MMVDITPIERWLLENAGSHCSQPEQSEQFMKAAHIIDEMRTALLLAQVAVNKDSAAGGAIGAALELVAS